MALIYEDKTKVLLRCLFDVQNDVGLGRQERAYQQGCEMWLEENGIPYEAKPPHHVRLGEEIVHTFYPDLVVWDLITVELKAVRRKVQKTEWVQLIDYLKNRGDQLGLMVNMGLERVDFERIPYHRPQYELQEDCGYWTDRIGGSDREAGAEIREGLHAVFKAHGCGYGEEVTKKLVVHEISRRGLSVVDGPVSTAYFHGTEVDRAPIDSLLVAGRILVTLSALFDENSFNISRGLSYMKALGLEWGVAVDFGRRTLRVNGLHLQP